MSYAHNPGYIYWFIWTKLKEIQTWNVFLIMRQDAFQMSYISRDKEILDQRLANHNPQTKAQIQPTSWLSK